MKNAVAIDIETISNRQYERILPDPIPDPRLKDPQKIKNDIEKKIKKSRSEMGLNPHLNLICCFGWFDGEDGGTIILENNNEAELLIETFEILSNYSYFITFNGRQFDIPCINLHCVSNGIRIPINISSGKFNKPHSNHTDIRLLLANNNPTAKGSLDFFLKRYLGSQKKEGIDGSKIQDFWDIGLKEEIAEYCLDDCKKTWELAELLYKSGMFEI